MNLPDQVNVYGVDRDTGELFHINSLFRNHPTHNNWNSLNGCTPEKLLSAPKRKSGVCYFYCATLEEIKKLSVPFENENKHIRIITPLRPSRKDEK